MNIVDRFRVDGQAVFVNGGGRGIGAACAIALAQAGADVAIRAKTPTEIAETADVLRTYGHRVLTFEATDEPGDDVLALDHAAGDFGRLTTLVNVVGGARSGPFMSTTDQQLREAFDTNVVLPVRLTRAAVPHLLAAGGGTIVNISTAMAHQVARGFVTYGTVKAALQHATKLLAADLSPRIRVNAVAPGAILTEGLRNFIRINQIGDDALSAIPMRRLGEPDDIAAAVLYLCSPASSYVTGTVLDVDGGIEQPAFPFSIPDL